MESLIHIKRHCDDCGILAVECPLWRWEQIDDDLARNCYIFIAVNVFVGLVALARNQIQPPLTLTSLAWSVGGLDRKIDQFVYSISEHAHPDYGQADSQRD